jgi:hypothetical protein
LSESEGSAGLILRLCIRGKDFPFDYFHRMSIKYVAHCL